MSKSATKILNTAEQLFNQNSFNSVGVDLIRDESGCSKTTMYTYFNNKQKLIVSVLKTRDQRFRESLNNFVAESSDLTAIERIFDWHVQWFQQDTFKGCLFIRAVSESSKQEQEIIDVAKQHKVWLQHFIQQHLIMLEHKNEVAELIYTFLESLISRFLVEGFNSDLAQNNKQLLLKLIQLLQSGSSKIICNKL